MKKILLVAVVFVFSALGHANEKAGKDPACHEVKMACEAAGFKKGHRKEGKGLMKDCMHKLQAGEAVPGVTVAADKIAACKTKMDEKKAK